MTLGELAEYVCTKLGQTDEESAAACKLFLRRRYQMIWDMALWKESLFTRSVTTTSAVCVLPNTCDQVVAVRIGDRALRQVDQSLLMREDPAAYSRAGSTPEGYVFLSPTCLTQPTSGSMSITAASTSDLDSGLELHLIGELNNGQEVRETVTLRGTVPSTSMTGFANLMAASLSAPAEGVVTVAGESMRPGTVHLDARPRVRLLEYSGELVTVSFLCKRRFTDLVHEGDVPLLRDCENALLAFAAGDMLERQRQYAKAQMKTKEGQAQIQIVLDLERNQSAHEQRIVPVDLHGTGSAGFGQDGKGVW